MRLHDSLKPIFCLAFFWTANPAQAASVPVEGPPNAVRDIQDRIENCKVLSDKFQALAKSGLFDGIRIIPPQDIKRYGPFQALTARNTLFITPAWIDEQERLVFDAISPGEILPQNICFGLAHLAEHLENRGPLTLSNAHGKDAWVQARLTAEAKAFIAGWNTAMLAAINDNKGQPLNREQMMLYGINLHYGYVFEPLFKAGQPRPFTKNNLLKTDTETVTRLVQALGTIKTADIE